MTAFAAALAAYRKYVAIEDATPSMVAENASAEAWEIVANTPINGLSDAHLCLRWVADLARDLPLPATEVAIAEHLGPMQRALENGNLLDVTLLRMGSEALLAAVNKDAADGHGWWDISDLISGFSSWLQHNSYARE